MKNWLYINSDKIHSNNNWLLKHSRIIFLDAMSYFNSREKFGHIPTHRMKNCMAIYPDISTLDFCGLRPEGVICHPHMALKILPPGIPLVIFVPLKWHEMAIPEDIIRPY